MFLTLEVTNYMNVLTPTYHLHGRVWILPHDIQLNSPAVHIWFGGFATFYSQNCFPFASTSNDTHDTLKKDRPIF